MRDIGLPSPGQLTNSLNLRRAAAAAISSVEVVAGRTPGGKVSTAAPLAAFFTACANALSAFSDAAAPTVSSRVRNSATQSTITFNEPLDTSVVPAAAAFAISGGSTVTGVAVVGSTIVLTGTGHTAGQTVTYTQPSTNAARDPVGNLVASFSGALA